MSDQGTLYMVGSIVNMFIVFFYIIMGKVNITIFGNFIVSLWMAYEFAKVEGIV